MTAKPRRSTHVYIADPDLTPHPADIEQRGVCAVCHLLGEAGDTHHTVPEPVQDVRGLAAGERGEE